MKRIALGAIALLTIFAPAVATRAAGPITPPSVPEKQWVVLPLPSAGKGISRMDKHVAVAFSPLNNRIYFTGGDYLAHYCGPQGARWTWDTMNPTSR